MKIVFVSSLGSIHAARWINQFKEQGWEINIFHGIDSNSSVCPEFSTGTLYVPYKTAIPNQLNSNICLPHIHRHTRMPFYKFFSRRRESIIVNKFIELICEVKPDIIHSLGLNINWRNMMMSVYKANRIMGGFKIPWIYSSWGADLCHYARLSQSHTQEVGEILSCCDYHISECNRDGLLARELGFRGKLLGYLPAFGGVSWDAEHITQGISPSNRRVILIKGRDQGGGDPQGRALSIIKALSLCKDALKGYRIIIGAASPNVASEAETLSKETGLNIEIFQHLEYENWLKIMGTARVLLAATVTDGLPSTLVEAMSLGVLPIHSGLEPIREWIDDGKNGLLIQPDNIEGIAKSLRLALRDDGLVEQAAALNRAIVAEKLSFEAVKNKAIEMYEYVLSHGKTAG